VIVGTRLLLLNGTLTGDVVVPAHLATPATGRVLNHSSTSSATSVSGSSKRRAKTRGICSITGVSAADCKVRYIASEPRSKGSVDLLKRLNVQIETEQTVLILLPATGQ